MRRLLRLLLWAACLVTGALIMTPGTGAQPASTLLPQPPRDKRPGEAQAAFQAGEYERASELYRSYLRDHPDNADAWLFLGWSRYRLGDFESAREAFLESQRANPDSVDAQVALGYTALQVSGPSIAGRYFQDVIEENPDRIDALEGMVLAGRRDNAPDWVVQAGAEAASRLESELGKDIEILLASTTLEAGAERKLEFAPADGPLRVPYRAGIDYLEEQREDGAWVPIFVKGVNLGPALPGRFAANAPTREDTYREWIGQISALGANTIRLYTILPPAFYHALAWHNTQPGTRRIWLIQGVWTELPPEHDFSDPAYVRALRNEITRTIDAVHGNIAIGPRRSHAWGTYDTDVSPYLLAYVIGREWEPFAVVDYNAMYKDRTEWSGRWLTVSGARAMETWVAQMCDFAADYEARQYRVLHPLTFANWPTLDPLFHFTEATWAQEDMFRPEHGLLVHELKTQAWDDDAVSLDSTLIRPTEEMKAGFFAAYHIYPNFPDFMNREYRDGRDDRGPNQYIAYLQALKAYHGSQPVLVAEFGISTSRGIAHVQPLGWHHGGLDERRQGELIARMLHNIYDSDYAGGIVFEFMDEWFKGTWSVAPLEVPPERRRLWFNAESPEQSYGLIAVRPASQSIRIDGELSDWGETPVYAAD